MKQNIFIEGIPVVAGSQASEIAAAFQWTLRQQGLKGVCYRTGMKCGAWSLDVYLIPENEEKPYFQKNCKGLHLISLKYGYFARGSNGTIMQIIRKYNREQTLKRMAKDFVDCLDFYLDLDYEGKTIKELVGKDNAALNQNIEIYLEENKILIEGKDREELINNIYEYKL